MSEEALLQAHAERRGSCCVLRVAENSTIYWRVMKQGPYYLARSPEGQQAAAKQVPLVTSEKVLQQAEADVFGWLIFWFIVGNPLCC